MNKTELIAKVAENANVSKKDASAVVDAMFDTIVNTLAKGEKVQLVGFGNFEVRERAERLAKNPQTGETVTVAAHKVPSFKAGKAFKDLINK